jgi:Zn-dependent protease
LGSFARSEFARALRILIGMESSRPTWPEPAPAPSQAPPQPEYEPIHPGSGRGDWRERLKKFLGPIAVALIAVATKAKAILLLLPKIKILSTSGTMLVSIAAYALIWGWPFAVGFVFLLLLHEMGHVFQLRREGIPASAPMFIPFLGAVISAKSLGNDAAAEARVGLAGPILGTIATLVPLGIWLATGEEFWQALAYVGFFLNLFNLIPIVPLDGGRAMAALSPWVWFVGLAMMVALLFAFPNPILLLIVLIGGWESWRRWKARKTPEGQAYHAVPGRTRALIAAVYLGLILALGIGMYETFLEKDFGDV